MNLGLPGKTFFITGAASGIGAAAVGLLLEAGANVAACDRDQDGLDRLKAKGKVALQKRRNIYSEIVGCSVWQRI